MPAVVADLGGAGLYPWVFSSYAVARMLLIPGFGHASDAWGRRDAYLVGVGLFGLGSVICALAPSMEVLVAGRVVQGLGAASLITLPVTIFGDLYAVAERTRMQGYYSLVWGVSSLIGPVLGGYVTETFSWRGIFWLSVPPGLLSLGLIGVLIPRHLGRGHTEGPGYLAALSLISIPTLQAITVAGVFLGACLVGLVGYLPVWIQVVEGGGALAAGMAIVPLSLSWTVASNLAGYAVARHGFRRLVLFGLSLGVIGTGIAAWSIGSRFGLVLFGLGMGFSISSFNVTSQEVAPEALKGKATALGIFARSVGSAVGVTAFGWLAGFQADVGSFEGVANLEAGLGRVFWSIFGCCVAALVVCLWRFERRGGQ